MCPPTLFNLQQTQEIDEEKRDSYHKSKPFAQPSNQILAFAFLLNNIRKTGTYKPQWNLKNNSNEIISSFENFFL